MLSRILLVEDEPLIRETLADLLSGIYVIKSTCNGSKALEVLPLYRPHLIISDIMMPEMDGISLLKALKSGEDWNDIPVILLTARGEFEDRIQGLDTGADAYIAKPFNFQELSLIVRNLLGLKTNILKGSYTHKTDFDETNGKVLFIKRLTDFLDDHLSDNNISLTLLADHFSISISGFKAKLKRTTGKTFLEFVREFRLKKSREYLVTQNYNVSEVAQMTGFRSVAHFSDAFKRFFGVSPSNLLI